jgi:TRAP-type C4-dicarboxylate transport system permease small subunit
MLCPVCPLIGGGYITMVAKFERYLQLFSGGLNRIGMAGLFLMAMVTIVDVIGSKIFSRPLFGSDEILGASQVIAISSAFAFTQILHGHTEVDFFANRMGRAMESFIRVFAPFAGLVLFIILSWNLYSYGASLRAAGEVTSSARLPLYPFVFYMAFCFTMTSFVLLTEFIHALLKTGRTT